MQGGNLHPDPGPVKPYPGHDPGDPLNDSGFKYLEKVYLTPAKTAFRALGAMVLEDITANYIIRVILDNTTSVDQSSLYDEYKTANMKIAIVYGFWLTCSMLDEECSVLDEEKKRKKLEAIKDAVFFTSGVESDDHAKRDFKWLLSRDPDKYPMDMPPGPLHTKFLETISRIADHLYIK